MRRRPTWSWLLAQCVQHGLGIEWEVEQTGVRARDLDGAEVAGQRAKECGVTDRRPAALICQNEQIGLAAAEPSCAVLGRLVPMPRSGIQDSHSAREDTGTAGPTQGLFGGRPDLVPRVKMYLGKSRFSPYMTSSTVLAS